MFYVDWFWVFVLGIVVAAITSAVLRSNSREKTIRTAIEKGATLDPATLEALRNHMASSGGNPRFGLLVGSIMTFFVGVGLVVMSVFIRFGEGGVVWPLIGVAGFLWCISAGLFVASRFAPGPQNP